MTASMMLRCLVLACVLAASTCLEFERDNDVDNGFSQDSDNAGFLVNSSMNGDYDVMPGDGSQGDQVGLLFGCVCISRTGCKCCKGRRWTYGYFVKIKLYACMRMSLLPTGGAYLIFSLNGRNVFYHKVSLRFLPRPCSKVPKLPGIISSSQVCLEFYHVNPVTKKVCTHITGYIKITWHTYKVYANLGCITLPKPRRVDPEMSLDTWQLGDDVDVRMTPVDNFDIDKLPEDFVENTDELHDDTDELDDDTDEARD